MLYLYNKLWVMLAMGYEDLIGEIQLVLLQVKNIAKDSEYFLRLF